jgi:hypothetical protein
VFDFVKWQDWLSTKANLFREAGRDVHFREAPEGRKKPSFTIELVGEKTLAHFTTWNTGETDWTVMPKIKSSKTPLAHRWGVILNDDSYESAFAEFTAAVSKFETRTPASVN